MTERSTLGLIDTSLKRNLKGFFDMNDYFSNPSAPPEHIPVCVSLHLNRFDKFFGEEVELKWVEYFLTNALVLEKLEIYLKSSEVSEDENDPIVEGECGGDADADSEGEWQEEEQGQKEEEGAFEPDLERNFEIAKKVIEFSTVFGGLSSCPLL